MSINVSKRSIGINFDSSGTAHVQVWSPLAKEVRLIPEKGTPLALKKHEYGYWRLVTDRIKPGDSYRFSIDSGQPYPDPASLSQPDGVHNASEAVDLHDFNWTDLQWKNVPLEEYIIYELHAGTFTPEGNFEGIAEKLDQLVQLGITAIEIMPVGQFPGNRNWGYDGVFPFAVQHSYGGAKGLQQLVNACHEKGLAVILDVIYNHIGPEGNYLPQFGPYFTDKYKTPWGQALNFDDAWSDGVREYVIENALMWFRDFHIDALRMDAVHAIRDLGTTHVLKAIRQKTDELSHAAGKPFYLIAELDLNNPTFINPLAEGGYGADAQWIDEFHHALRVASGQAKEGYYADFNGIGDLAKSYRDAYVYDGQFSHHRKKFFGTKTRNPGHQFVVFSQNHDHVGNRMMGERTSALVSFEMCKLLAGAVLVSPYLPMLFMGEEWAEANPFQFFIDHTDKELAALVNKGRKEEFATFNWAGEPPDPRLEKTYTDSILQWQLRQKEPHSNMLRFYQRLIHLRKSEPALHSTVRGDTQAEADNEKQLLTLTRKSQNDEVCCLLNFSGDVHETLFVRKDLHVLLDSASEEWGGKGNPVTNSKEEIFIQPESIIIIKK